MFKKVGEKMMSRGVKDVYLYLMYLYVFLFCIGSETDNVEKEKITRNKGHLPSRITAADRVSGWL